MQRATIVAYMPCANVGMTTSDIVQILFFCISMCALPPFHSIPQVSYGDEKFPPREQGPIVATPTYDLLRRAGDVAQVELQMITTANTSNSFCSHKTTHNDGLDKVLPRL